MNLLTKQLTEDLTTFAQSSQRNRWFKYPEVALYIRKSIRIKYNTYSALDIGQITVDPRGQGQGVGSKILNIVEEVAKANGYRAVFVENVMNDRWASGLVKRGYLLYDNLYPPSYIKILPL